MKRSDAVKAVEKILLEHFGDLTHNVGEDILKSLEELGMKAPYTSGAAVIGRDRHGRPAAFDVGGRGSRQLWECEDNELEQLKKELADASWQEPEE